MNPSGLRARLASLRGRRLAIACALVAILAAGFTLRAVRAADPTYYTSQDEAAYRSLAQTMANWESYSRAESIDPFHWPPGAPLVFATSMIATGDDSTTPAYWAQAIVSAATILVAFLLAWRLAGELAGLAAAAAVAFYPPLLRGPGDLLSEPLGALFLAVTMLLGLRALRDQRPWSFGLAGGALGFLVLTRADHLLLPAVLIGALAVWLWRRGERVRPQVIACGAGVLAVVVPWVLYASITEKEPVIVTRGGGSALFIGTYLPGDGTTAGLKREFADEFRAARPEYADRTNYSLPAGQVLDYIAYRRRPGEDRNGALQTEGFKNLWRYGVRDPLDFVAMMAEKAWRMWSQPFGGGNFNPRFPEKLAHSLLVSLALVGLVLGVWRTRHPILVAILLTLLLATAIHTIVVSQPRYNLPLLPALFAGGAAGWALSFRGQAASEK